MKGQRSDVPINVELQRVHYACGVLVLWRAHLVNRLEQRGLELILNVANSVKFLVYIAMKREGRSVRH